MPSAFFWTSARQVPGTPLLQINWCLLQELRFFIPWRFLPFALRQPHLCVELYLWFCYQSTFVLHVYSTNQQTLYNCNLLLSIWAPSWPYFSKNWNLPAEPVYSSTNCASFNDITLSIASNLPWLFGFTMSACCCCFRAHVVCESFMPWIISALKEMLCWQWECPDLLGMCLEFFANYPEWVYRKKKALPSQLTWSR